MAKLILQDGTEVEAFTADEMKAAVEKETGGLKAKLDELLGETKTAKQRARELEEAQTAAEEERQREKGEFKSLYEREQQAKKELADKFSEFQSKAQRQEISLEAQRLAGQLSKDRDRSELLAEKVAQLAKHTDAGVRFEIGGVEVEHDKVLAHLKSKYPFLVDASGVTGGGAPNNMGGGAADTNPFAKGESFNLTEQARITRENPQMAAQLKQAASR